MYHKLVLTVFLFIFIVAPILSQTKLSMDLPDLPPYTVVSDGKVSGLGVDWVNQISTKIGIKIDLVGVPNYGKAMKDVQMGTADGFFLASQNKERDAIAKMTKPLTINNWIWVLPAKSTLDPKSSDFKSKAQIVVMLNSSQHKWLQDNKYKISSAVGSTSLLIGMLEKQRCEAIFVPEMVWDEEIKLAGKSSTDYKKVLQEAKPFGIYLSLEILKKYPTLMDKFNKAIDEILKP